MNDAALQVRVIQGHEPRHFLKIFKGQLITYTDDDDNNKIHLFRIRGTCADDVRATEQKAIASSLSSNDVFIVKTPSTAYIWNGIVSVRWFYTLASFILRKCHAILIFSIGRFNLRKRNGSFCRQKNCIQCKCSNN